MGFPEATDLRLEPPEGGLLPACAGRLDSRRLLPACESTAAPPFSSTISNASASPGTHNRVTTTRGHSNGQGKVRAHEAARERGDDWTRGPREDDADGRDHAD